MPYLVSCTTCKKDVSDTAEVCPHCGQDQPEKNYKDMRDLWINCPACKVKNYHWSFGSCRKCKRNLEEELIVRNMAQRLKRIEGDWREIGIIVGALLGVLMFIWYGHKGWSTVEWAIAVAFCGGLGAYVGHHVGGWVGRHIQRYHQWRKGLRWDFLPPKDAEKYYKVVLQFPPDDAWEPNPATPESTNVARQQ